VTKVRRPLAALGAAGVVAGLPMLGERRCPRPGDGAISRRAVATGGYALFVSVVVVAEGSPVGVDPGGWEEFGSAVGGDPDGPVAVVDQGVVVAAE
jgi:hypothetical protein